MGFVFFWSWKNFRKNKSLILCFVIISVAFSLVVCSLIVSKSMISGMEDRLVNLSSGHLLIYDSDDIQSEAEFSSYKVVNGFVMLYSKDGNCSVAVKGISDGYLEPREKYITCIRQDVEGFKKIIISKNISEKLLLSIGDKVAMLIVPDKSSKAVRPDIAVVSGIYDSGYAEIDDNLIYADYDFAKRMFTDDSSVSTEIILKNPSEKELYRIREKLGKYRSATWMQLNFDVYENYVKSNQAVTLILFIVILLSGYFTVSVSQQIVFDQKNNIGICRILGADKKTMLKSVVLSVLTTVFAAEITGLVLGLICGCNICPIIKILIKDKDVLKNYLLDFDIVIPYLSVAVMGILQLAISFICILIQLHGDFSHNDKLGII